jgi:ribosome-binding protein aMBF1 (putative translation factor)
MKLTIDHPQARPGVPVFVDARGRVIPYADGVRRLRRTLDLSTSDLARACGCSHRTVEGWEQGRLPSAAALNTMTKLLKLHTP